MQVQLFEGDLPKSIKLGSEIAIDTETMGLNIKRDRLCLVQIADAKGNIYIVRFKKDEYKAVNLVKVLNDEKVLKIFHYARFDLATLMVYLPECEPRNIFCTKIASFLVRTYTDRHGLRNLVRELLGVELDKYEQTSYWGADKLTEKQIEYAASDVIYLHKVKDILVERLKREDRLFFAVTCFDFLPIRVLLDLEFGENFDVFAHCLPRS